jgi:peptide-methionine (S)-S-oxide reductase
MRGNSYLAAEMTAIYPDINDLVASTVAARINGYLGGYGTMGQLEAQIDRLGLSADGRQRLLDAASRRISGPICGRLP